MILILEMLIGQQALRPRLIMQQIINLNRHDVIHIHLPPDPPGRMLRIHKLRLTH